jgi:hypothetical protein
MLGTRNERVETAHGRGQPDHAGARYPLLLPEEIRAVTARHDSTMNILPVKPTGTTAASAAHHA